MTKSSLVDFFYLYSSNVDVIFLIDRIKTLTLLEGQSQGDFLTTDKLQHKSVVNQ